MKRNRAQLLLIVGCSLSVAGGCTRNDWEAIPVASTLEDATPEGDLYTPATQSFLRGNHWLESVEAIAVSVDRKNDASIAFLSSDDSRRLALENVPMEYLVPRLHYPAESPPDDFDAFNLMLSEYSRNSMSMPVGRSGDSMAHFATDLQEAQPWSLAGDYNFIPDATFRPLRVGVTNNCLQPGLWELSAVDRAGELYHSWFEMPAGRYVALVAKANGVDTAFLAQALAWSEDPVELDLDRLRREIEDLGTVAVVRSGGAVSYSSDDSRLKLAKSYVLVDRDGQPARPEDLDELVAGKVKMSDFVPPGKYSLEQRKEFDLGFLAEPRSVRVRTVHPLTNYRMDSSSKPDLSDHTHLEWTFDLGEHRRLVVGNLPLPLLVEQEDFVLHGFGVGILSSSGLAERRRLLIEHGHHPSYAYLTEEVDGVVYALNSHAYGLEQIFIRSHPFDPVPFWEVTVASFERIVDLAKYQVSIPASLIESSRNASTGYVAPIYFRYRDDNLR